MKILTSGCSGKKLKEIKKRGMSVLLTPPDHYRRGFDGYEVALDNGAFSCWLRGAPFDGDTFIKHLSIVSKHNYTPYFIVCPDIVAGGFESLNFSLEWSDSEYLLGMSNLYLAVQDGIRTSDITPEIISKFSGIFIGGTIEWKWRTAERWVGFAHQHNMKCHIGRCGSIDKLITAHKLGADSVDSSSFARNDSWHIIDKFNDYLSGNSPLLF